MRKHNKDLFLILILAIMNIAWTCFPLHFALMSIVLALPLVFLGPGYLLIEILKQKREHDGATHLLLSIGLSLAIDLLGGLLLNIVPVGLTVLTWHVFFGALTIVCVLLCVVKRRRWQIRGDQKPRDLPTHYEILLLLFTICVVVFAFVYTTNTIANQKYQGFTQFWLLLDNHQYPPCTIRLGIESSETVATTYQVEVKENNQRAAHWSSITLAPRQKWQRELPLVRNPDQTAQLQIEADLYRQQEPKSIYRTVKLFLSPCNCICF